MANDWNQGPWGEEWRLNGAKKLSKPQPAPYSHQQYPKFLPDFGVTVHSVEEEEALVTLASEIPEGEVKHE